MVMHCPHGITIWEVNVLTVPNLLVQVVQVLPARFELQLRGTKSVTVCNILIIDFMTLTESVWLVVNSAAPTWRRVKPSKTIGFQNIMIGTVV